MRLPNKNLPLIPSTCRSSFGFTLIELVVTIVLIAIISGMLAPFIKYNIEGFVDTRIRSELTAKGRVVLERLTRELREADPATIQITAGDTIQFTQLQNLSGITNIGGNLVKVYDACRNVVISKSGSSLFWDEGANGIDATLTGNVSSVLFSYQPGTSIRSGVITVHLTLFEADESVIFYREIHIRNTLGNKSPCTP